LFSVTATAQQSFRDRSLGFGLGLGRCADFSQMTDLWDLGSDFIA
jgi:hypothetical protein